MVTRFGGGSASDVAFIQSDGTAGVVPGLNSQRRRLGLTQASDGSLFDSYFVKTNGGRAGSVAKLTLDGSEVEVTSGLKKPVGVLVVGDVFYVSD